MKIATAVLAITLFGLQKTDLLSKENEASSRFRAESSAYVIRGRDAWTYVTENRSFHFVEVLGDSGNYEAELLLEETYHNEHTDGIEGTRGNAAVKAWTLKPDRQRHLRWSLQQDGNEGEMHGRLFRVLAWGCCDMPTVSSYYSVLTGKKLYNSNSDLLEIRGPGNGPLATRYLAFGYAGMRTLSEPPRLQYGTDEKVAQSFLVLSERQYYDAPQMFVSTSKELEKAIDLSSSPLSFTIVLKYSDDVEIRVPVEADVIHAEKAVLPKGYSLRAVI